MARYTGVYGFPEHAVGARALAAALEIPCHIAEVHRFPDGESLVRLPDAVERAVVFRSLDRPNDKLVELALTASVLRRQGAATLCLVAPYMAYMRQDAVFHPGEPVSQTVVGGWLAALFDRFVCVEPHLHRADGLDTVFPGRPAIALPGAGPIAGRLGALAPADSTIVVGPDEESEPLVRGVAARLNLPWTVGRKVRRGDRDVTVDLPFDARLAGRPAVIVDDVISSGGTVLSCLEAVRARGGHCERAFTVHALHDAETASRFERLGLIVESCDGVPHPSNTMPLAGPIAAALTDGPPR